MHIGIFYNENQVSKEDVLAIEMKLLSRGARCTVFSSPDSLQDCERLLVLGGDGTVLRAAKCASAKSIPLVGINYGRLGFLTEFEREEMDAAVELILSENCEIVARTMLEAELNGEKCRCLNELALLRGVSPERANRVEAISVAFDGRTARDFVADGLIVATPTGSTAYSLSAGGSILLPDCSAFLLTPVCAFSMKSRPIVYSDTGIVAFSITAGDTLMAYADGEFLGVVGEQDKLTVRKSEERAIFLTRDRHGFFLRLTQKIN